MFFYHVYKLFFRIKKRVLNVFFYFFLTFIISVVSWILLMKLLGLAFTVFGWVTRMHAECKKVDDCLCAAFIG